MVLNIGGGHVLLVNCQTGSTIWENVHYSQIHQTNVALNVRGPLTFKHLTTSCVKQYWSVNGMY